MDLPRGSTGSTPLKGWTHGPNVGPNPPNSRVGKDKRHVGGELESAQKAAREGKGDSALEPDNLSLFAEGATAPQSTEQVQPENDVARDDSRVETEEEVFEMARAYFGLEPMRERAGAA
jgi:hypothetical protein